MVFDFSDSPTDALVISAGTQQVRDFRATLTIGNSGDQMVATSKIISAIAQIYGQQD
jgi:hypothetical protein